MSERSDNIKEFIERRRESIPKEPGLYFARTINSQWWNLIVKIIGEGYYLHYVCWSFIDDKVSQGFDPEELEAIFSEKIESPEIDIVYKKR